MVGRTLATSLKRELIRDIGRKFPTWKKESTLGIMVTKLDEKLRGREVEM